MRGERGWGHAFSTTIPRIFIGLGTVSVTKFVLIDILKGIKAF